LQIINEPAEQTVTVVSAMGSCAESPVKVTDLILNMIDKAARQVRAARGKAAATGCTWQLADGGLQQQWMQLGCVQ
jgi:aspartokinase